MDLIEASQALKIQLANSQNKTNATIRNRAKNQYI